MIDWARVVAAVPVFGLDPAQAAAIQGLARAAASRSGLRLVACDGSPGVAASPLRPFDDPGIPGERMAWGENPGVSACYNLAARRAAQFGAEFLLLVDQDLADAEALLATLERAVAAMPDESVWCPRLTGPDGRILSPFRVVGGVARPCAPAPGPDRGRLFAVNHGLLVRLTAYQAAGGYDEAIGLDFADFAFCARLQRTGQRLAVAEGALAHDWSSHAATDRDRELARFARFVQGGVAWMRGYPGNALCLPWIALRAIRLALRHRDPVFAAAAWRAFRATSDGAPLSPASTSTGPGELA